ncbi:MAG: sugar transferase [Candidatus Acidiferrum sp.]|jgi:lipopolysaccharide/colanic/teichoic acid biosynthesis glycosyltransferase
MLPKPQSFYARRAKRWCDLFFSLLGLVVLSPLFLVCALLIKLSSPGPVFFRQLRSGVEGRPFRIFKFRTMFTQGRAPSSLLTASGDSRITPAGRWLRNSKIDELPQLINVLTGDMSLVGPRPEVPRYTDRYSLQQREILRVKPGITSLASVAFSGEEKLLAAQEDKELFYVKILMPYKIALDLEHCRHITLAGDVRVLFQTMGKLLRRPGGATVIPANPVIGSTSNDESFFRI